MRNVCQGHGVLGHDSTLLQVELFVVLGEYPSQNSQPSLLGVDR